jgi:hypothetical protein
VRAEGWAEADKAEAQRNPGAKREHRIILRHAPRKCGEARFSQFSMSCRVNFHANGFGVRLLNSSYNANRTRIASSFAKSFGVNTFLWMIEK